MRRRAASTEHAPSGELRARRWWRAVAVELTVVVGGGGGLLFTVGDLFLRRAAA
ncbi:hypothetical protein Dimus_036592, partial [Dionaea muscipula]